MATLAKIKAKSSQAFVPIEEIRNGMVLLEDKTARMILMCSTLNFALKSAAEQEAIISQYQDFLNSLDFSLQFYIQSRPLNIEPYLDTLRDAEKKQLNELLKVQIREYIDFVKNFVTMTQIVSKNFYAVVTYAPSESSQVAGGGKLPPGFSGILSNFMKKKPTKADSEEEGRFEEIKSQIQQRAQAVIQGLARVGIKAVSLNTEELIELYYKIYNPGELTKGGLVIPKIESKEQKTS